MSLPQIAWDMLCSGDYRPLYPNNPSLFPSEFLPDLNTKQLDMARTVWNSTPEIWMGGINGSPDWCLLAEICMARGVKLTSSKRT